MCAKCRGAHHRSICTEADTNAQQQTPPATVSKIDVAPSNFTYLQTARVEIIGPNGVSTTTRCVLHGGSQTSFVSKSLIDTLKLDVVGHQDLAISVFESSPGTSSPTRLVRMELKSIWSGFSTHISTYKSTYEFLPLPSVRLSPSTVLLLSHLGWIMSGRRAGISTNAIAVHFLHAENRSLWSDAEVKRFWELETIGITAHQDRRWDSSIIQAFHDSFRTEANRRVVSLPRKRNVTIPTVLLRGIKMKFVIAIRVLCICIILLPVKSTMPYGITGLERVNTTLDALNKQRHHSLSSSSEKAEDAHHASNNGWQIIRHTKRKKRYSSQPAVQIPRTETYNCYYILMQEVHQAEPGARQPPKNHKPPPIFIHRVIN